MILIASTSSNFHAANPTRPGHHQSYILEMRFSYVYLGLGKYIKQKSTSFTCSRKKYINSINVIVFDIFLICFKSCYLAKMGSSLPYFFEKNLTQYICWKESKLGTNIFTPFLSHFKVVWKKMDLRMIHLVLTQHFPKNKYF